MSRAAADPATRDAPRGTNVVLIGFRGAGKTSVGRRLAELLNRPFIDTDEIIAREAGRTIRDIFAQSGEAAFRAAETDVIARVTAGERQVISVGGGAVLSRENRARLRACGRCIWLSASEETLRRRIAADSGSADSRPPLIALDPAREFSVLLAQREAFYGTLAEIQVNTEGLSVEDIVNAVGSVLSIPPRRE